VHCEPGRVRRDFKQNAAGFPVVDRVEIFSVDHGRDVVTQSRKFLLPRILLLVFSRPPRDVMDRPHGHSPGSFLRSSDYVSDCSGIARLRSIAEPVPLLLDQPQSHGLCEQSSRSLVAGLRKRSAVKSMNRILRRDGAIGVGSLSSEFCGSDQFDSQTVRIGKRKYRFAKSLGGLAVRDLMFLEPLHPKWDGAFWHGKRSRRNLPSPFPPPGSLWPWKKRHDCSRMSDAIAVVEMISARVIEIDGELYKQQA